MTDDLTAELDRIAAETRTFGASGEDTALLLAAVEAVLKLADELEHVKTGPPSGKEDEGAALGLRWADVKVREVITTALTGTENPSAPPAGTGEDERHG